MSDEMTLYLEVGEPVRADSLTPGDWIARDLLGISMIWRVGAPEGSSVWLTAHPLHDDPDGMGHTTSVALDALVVPVVVGKDDLDRVADILDEARDRV